MLGPTEIIQSLGTPCKVQKPDQDVDGPERHPGRALEP